MKKSDAVCGALGVFCICLMLAGLIAALIGGGSDEARCSHGVVLVYRMQEHGQGWEPVRDGDGSVIRCDDKKQ